MRTPRFRHPMPFGRAMLLVLAITGTAMGAAALPAAAGPTGPGDEVYSTDFTNPAVTAPDWDFKNGSTTEYGDGYALNMEPGAFTVALDGAANLWLSPETGELPDDQIVETTIVATGGDSSLLAGVVCRGSLDDDLGYQFLVGLDGYYTIATITGHGPRRLANPKGTKRTDAIDCQGLEHHPRRVHQRRQEESPRHPLRERREGRHRGRPHLARRRSVPTPTCSPRWTTARPGSPPTPSSPSPRPEHHRRTTRA